MIYEYFWCVTVIIDVQSGAERQAGTRIFSQLFRSPPFHNNLQLFLMYFWRKCRGDDRHKQRKQDRSTPARQKAATAMIPSIESTAAITLATALMLLAVLITGLVTQLVEETTRPSGHDAESLAKSVPAVVSKLRPNMEPSAEEPSE